MKKIILSSLFVFCLAAVSIAQKNDTITTASGLKYFITHKGNGPAIKPGWLAIYDYTLTLTNGTKIDATYDRGTPFAQVYPSTHYIKGSNEAMGLLHVGDEAIVLMPYSLAYGEKGNGPIPPKATLRFDIIMRDTKEKSLEMVLDSMLFTKGDTTKTNIALVVKTFNDLKAKKFDGLYVSENDLNDMGYEIIKKFPADAVELFKLNVDLYPNSFNVYDSLGEGYMDIGKKDLAIANYEKSLQLNPKNTNGEEMLKKLKAPRPNPDRVP
jgi:tetratricopeptide (TPR) repeat protein